MTWAKVSTLYCGIILLQGISKGMSCSAQQARAAVDVGYWPLWRWNPPTDGHHLIHVDGQGTSVAVKKGKLSLDSKKQKGQLEDYLQGQVRICTTFVIDSVFWHSRRWCIILKLGCM